MISQRQVQRQYEKLMHEVKTKEFYTDIDLASKINCYTCENCGHVTKTKDIDPGVTPFIMQCPACKETATSSFYNDIAPHIEPSVEWYRPSLEETMKLRKNPGTLEHVLHGGLLDRKM
jgi:RNase P subunit RPR2